MSKSEEFTSMDQKRPKNRGSQLLVIVSLLVTVLLAGMAWSVGHWDF
jgi:hypothetical protein